VRGFQPTPERIAVVTTKYWGIKGVRLTVAFLDNAPSDLRKRILAHMNAWGKTANTTFVETKGAAQVRIAREGGANGGYWSYLGTDILHIAKQDQTMNLEAFSMGTPESEFHRVVRHETGHTLGFPHEHMRRQLVKLSTSVKAGMRALLANVYAALNLIDPSLRQRAAAKNLDQTTAAPWLGRAWSKIVNTIGYQRTMVVGLLTMAFGAFLFLPAASTASLIISSGERLSTSASGPNTFSGVSRGTRMSGRRSFSMTSAARWIRLSASPQATAASVPMLQGQMTMASAGLEPEATGANHSSRPNTRN
jgi:hypothetical protein